MKKKRTVKAWALLEDKESRSIRVIANGNIFRIYETRKAAVNDSWSDFLPIIKSVTITIE